MDNAQPHRPFHLAWPLEAAREYKDAHERFDSGNPERRKAMDSALDQLSRAVGEHILYLAANQELSMPAHAEYVETGWLHYWTMANNHEPLEPYQLCLLGEPLAYAAGYRYYAHQEKSLEDLHQTLVQIVETGDFKTFETSTVHCHNSGRDLKLGMVGWCPTLHKLDLSTYKQVPLEQGDIAPEKTWHAEVHFPSGRVLAADWFRMEEFTRAMKPIQDGNDLGGQLKCAEMTRDMARDMDIVHVCVGNTTTRLSVSGGGIMAYRENEDDDPTLREHAAVINDMWWTTLVDEENLRRILGSGRSTKEVDSMIEQLVEDGAKRLEIPAGTYHLYYAGHHSILKNTINDMFVTDDDFKKAQTPLFSLRKEAFTLRQELPAPRKRKP